MPAKTRTANHDPIGQKLSQLAKKNLRYAFMVGDMIDYLLEDHEDRGTYAPCAFITGGELETVSGACASIRALQIMLEADDDDDEKRGLAKILELIYDRLSDLPGGELHVRFMAHEMNAGAA